MRWLGLALVLVAGLFLAWDAFRSAPPQDAPPIRESGRQTARLLSGIGITTGLLLIVVGSRKFDRGETGFA